jgi:fucose permease
VSSHASADPKRRLLILTYLGFVSLGLPDTVLGAAWPSLRDELMLPLDRAGLLLLVTTAGVVVSSSASGWLRARIGTGAVLVASTWMAAAALATTALARGLPALVSAALIAGLGGGAIDASLNDHVARKHGARHLTWLHACWGVGAFSAPLLVSTLLARGLSWRTAYGALSLLEGLLSFAFLAAAGWFGRERSAEASQPSIPPGHTGRLASVTLFFFYGGLEAGAGLWISSLWRDTRASSPALAGAAVALYWGALTVGRILSGLRADTIGPKRVLRAAPLLALVACVALATPGLSSPLAAIALFALGLALAPIYPLAMHDTTLRFGDDAARLIGYQVAAASLGVATLPWLLGFVARSTSIATLPWLLALLALVLIALEHGRRQ